LCRRPTAARVSPGNLERGRIAVAKLATGGVMELSQGVGKIDVYYLPEVREWGRNPKQR
jgi:hypothetical protein